VLFYPVSFPEAELPNEKSTIGIPSSKMDIPQILEKGKLAPAIQR
jgi:hypothetical protein